MNAIAEEITLNRVTPGWIAGRLWQALVIFVLLVGLALPGLQPVKAATIPTFSIVSVVKDDKVTIRTNNFPAGHLFTVRMGAFGTRGVGGEVVTTTNSGAGGTFEESYAIPESLKGSYRIAIRLESGGGYFAHNWFFNDTGAAPAAGYSGIPTFGIISVVRDDTVTIRTNNFPAGHLFTVRMGAYGTKGVGGVVVDTTNSGSGGAFEVTYNIPDSLKGSRRIAIRLESGSDYFAYNWFFNNTTGVSAPAAPGYSGIPTFSIVSVVRDDTVTIRTSNLPAEQLFTVRMGTYGTQAIGGVVVDTTNSGGGGAFEVTYNIPDSLKGSRRIAIRLESGSGYFAYNWFFNNTTF